jgi:hypothetical protein
MIIEINGNKIEVDERFARRIEEMRIGSRVKILKKVYDGHKVHPGVVVGFEPFEKLPTIVVAYVEEDWQKSEVKFAHFNAKFEGEMVVAADEDFHVDKDRILKQFDRQIAAKQREIDTIEEQKQYFLTNFRAYWEKVIKPAPAPANSED